MSLSIPLWSIILITLTEIPVELFWRDPNACSAWDSSRDLDQSWSQASFAVDQRVDPQVSLIFGSNVLTYPPGSYASSNAHHPHGAACEIVQASCSLKPPPSPERDKFRGHWFHDWLSVVLIPECGCRSTWWLTWPSYFLASRLVATDQCQLAQFEGWLRTNGGTVGSHCAAELFQWILKNIEKWTTWGLWHTWWPPVALPAAYRSQFWPSCM